MVDQTSFSTGSGTTCNGDSSVCANATVGDTTVGNTSSNGYQAFAGFNTTEDPYIEFVVTANTINLGYLTTSATTTAVGQFSVRAWQAGSYIVTTQSDPPTNTGSGAHQLATVTGSPAGTSPGTERFGINLVANTAPTTFGSDPVPTNGMAVGQAAAGYDTPDVYKYQRGDIVASANSSSSVTDYTVSYVFDISNVTPSGEYVFRHNLVAVGTY